MNADRRVAALSPASEPPVERLPAGDRAGAPAKVLGAIRRDSDVAFLAGLIVALCVFLSIASPFFLTQRNLTNILLQIAVLAMVSFGVTMIIIAGHFDLSVGSGLGLVMVVSALVMRDTGSVLMGVLAGLGVGLAVGLVNGLLVTGLGVPSFIATLGMLVAARGVGRGLSDGQTIGDIPSGFVDFMNDSFLGLRTIVWVAIAVFVVFHIVLRHTRLGVQMYAVGGNARAARLSGLRVSWVQTSAFLFSCAAFSIAGVSLLGRLGSADPNSGTLLELYSVAAVVVGGTSLYGGKGSIPRTLLGVLLIGVIQNGLNLLNVDPDMQMAILGAVFILAAISGVFHRERT